MLDTVLFELEGVLADTATARREALLASLRTNGVELTAQEYHETCAGLDLEAAARAAHRLRARPLDDTGAALCARRADDLYRASLGKGLVLVEGAREALERLHAVTRLGLVTRASRAEAGFVLSLARLEPLFTCVVAAEDARAAKPSPEPYRVALQRLRRRASPGRGGTIVAVEDGLPGIRAARAAGIPCVVVGDVPAHVALEADGYLPAITGLTPAGLLAIAAPRSEPIA
ncbi:MAG TPA: HAD family phosphatase [Gemmatimonadaceae bacterium]|nr:HAD family phosphatase [Gemmatimonadaceae bacterium]